MFIAPTIAGLLLFSTDFKAILYIDIISYIIGSLILWFSFKNLNFKTDKELKDLEIINKIKSGISLIAKDKNLSILLLLSSFTNFCFSVSFIFIAPYLLTLEVNEVNIGIIFTIGSIGQILGSVIVSKIKRPSESLKSELIGTIGLGIFGFIIIGSYPHFIFILIGYLLTMVVLSILNVWNRTNWQLLTPEEYQGRVFACRRSASSLLGVIGFALGGKLLDDVLIPLTGEYILAYQITFLFTGMVLVFNINQLTYVNK